MNAIAEQLAQATSKREETARKVWKAAVLAAADGKAMTEKQVEQLADARLTLGLTAERFDQDVNVWKELLVRRQQADASPTQAELEADQKAKFARIKEIDEEVKRLQQERNGIRAWIVLHSQAWVAIRQNLKDAERAAAHLLGD